MDLELSIGNGPTEKSGLTLTGDKENPTTTHNMMKTE